MGKPIDYLFSIVNPRILKADVLALPSKCAINYHDSLLPAYAGVHATSWAIIHNERQHGISWHVVESGIDTGDILKSEQMEILKDDSAFTLNLKCQEAAKRAFRDLLSDIKEAGIVKGRKQCDVGRSYFGLYAILDNLGVLSFDKPAEQIFNLARALEFGHHENTLGSPKIVTANGKYFLVTNVSLSTECGEQRRPGTILNVVDGTLVVDTASSPLMVSVAHLDGSTIRECQFGHLGLSKGKTLKANQKIITEPIVAVRKKEAFWKGKLVEYEPTVFYQQRINVVTGIIDLDTNAHIKSIELPLPQVTATSITEYGCVFIQACFVAFLARICCASTVCVGFLADKTGLPQAAKGLFSDITPGIFNVDLEADVFDVLSDCEASIKKLNASKTFLTDIFYRYPELRVKKRASHYNIVLGAGSNNTDDCEVTNRILQECNILLLFERSAHSMQFLYLERPAQDFIWFVEIIKHFSTFLSAIHNCRMQTKLRKVPMLLQSEIDNLYMDLHVPGSKPSEERLMELFEKQWKLTPTKIAIESTKAIPVYTYQEVLREVDRLSNAMREHLPSDGNEKTVTALYMANSTAYVLSMLATIKSGSAFLPLPPNGFPAKRLRFVLADASVRLLLTTKKTFENFNLGDFPVRMHLVMRYHIADEDLLFLECTHNASDNLPVLSDSTRVHDNNIPVFDQRGANQTNDLQEKRNTQPDFCYAIYTSVTTGKPKGVRVKESSVINLTKALIKEWNLEPVDTIAQFASIGFDASVAEIFTSLLCGAHLAILEETERLGNEFIIAMNKLKVTMILLPPSVLSVYNPTHFPSLRKIVAGGEICTRSIANKWTSGADIRFFNAYGPTEGTIVATCYEYKRGEDNKNVNQELPIGKAIDGVVVYIFDDFMNPVLPGVVGEIHIGGRGLADGYIGHAVHINDSKFVQNPFSSHTLPLYKTGDQAYADVDGCITCVGRRDTEVKIRGQRLDLIEIEQVLLQHPEIEMAVVVVHRCSAAREDSIAAFVAPTSICVSEVRRYLAEVLPQYMIPNFIKTLEVSDLPRTTNGKIDRKSLAGDESVHKQDSKDTQSLLDDTQLFVAKHWCTVLKLDESLVYSLHRHSSFHRLGGSSLQLVLLLRLIEYDLNIDFSFTDFGTADTLEEFSAVIRSKNSTIQTLELHDLKSEDCLRDLILGDAQLNPAVISKLERRHLDTIYHLIESETDNADRRPRNILISGVTGFLGAFLLAELIDQSSAHIYCMVRETTEARGLQRIVDNMRKYDLWKLTNTSRISAVIADISKEKMGISPDLYASLCSSVDTVFMNAAMMNFNTSYETHRMTNVKGTLEFINFASTGVPKYFFTTSSLTVFLFPSQNNSDQRRFCFESEQYEDPLLVEGGYGQSKWASERLVSQALRFLPGGAIFRPSRVSGRSTDGAGLSDDLLASTLVGMRRMGSYPDMDFPYDLTPVDYCAKAMVEIALSICNQTSRKETIYHLFNPNTIPFKELFRGMDLRPLPLDEWRRQLRQCDEGNKELVRLAPFFNSPFWDRSPYWPVFDTTNTDHAISDETKSLLLPTNQLLKKYKSFFGI